MKNIRVILTANYKHLPENNEMHYVGRVTIIEPVVDNLLIDIIASCYDEFIWIVRKKVMAYLGMDITQKDDWENMSWHCDDYLMNSLYPMDSVISPNCAIPTNQIVIPAPEPEKRKIVAVEVTVGVKVDAPASMSAEDVAEMLAHSATYSFDDCDGEGILKIIDTEWRDTQVTNPNYLA